MDRDAIEESVVGSLITNPHWVDETPKLDGKCFDDTSIRHVFTTIIGLINNGEQVDRLTVGVKAAIPRQEMANYMKQTATSLGQYREWVSLLLELKTKDALCDLGDYISSVSEDDNSKDALRLIEERIFSFTEDTAVTDAEPMQGLVFDWLDILDETNDNSEGMSTGYPSVDRILGPLQPGNMTIIAGRPSMGKTALALNMMIKLADAGFTPGMFSLEMTKQQVAKRVAANIADIDHYFLMSNTVSKGGQRAIREAFKTMGENMWIDTRAITVAEILSAGRRLVRKYGIDILFVDYLQLIRPDRFSGNRVSEVTMISQGLKSLAKTLQIPVIALSQLSRAVEQREDKRPILSDLRDSGSIEQDADAVIFLYRPDYYQGKKSETGIAEVIVEKNRHGPCDTCTLLFYPNKCRFKEPAKGQDDDAKSVEEPEEPDRPIMDGW